MVGCWFDCSLVDGGRSDDRFRKSRRRGGHTASRLRWARQSSRTVRVSRMYLSVLPVPLHPASFSSRRILRVLFRLSDPSCTTAEVADVRIQVLSGIRFHIFFFFFLLLHVREFFSPLQKCRRAIIACVNNVKWLCAWTEESKKKKNGSSSNADKLVTGRMLVGEYL